MRAIVLILSLVPLTIATTALAQVEPGWARAEAPGINALNHGFYCQPWQLATVSASVGYQSELADDIPSAYAGQTVATVTLYVGEWLAPWTDPQGIAVNFYLDSCPPPLAPDVHYEIPWTNVVATPVYPGPPMIIYEVVVPLPAPVVLQDRTSMGGYVIQDWGDAPPSCGFAMTTEIFGCGEAYWDAPFWPAPRWTRISTATGQAYDLAYCLTGPSTSIAAEGDILIETWGKIKSLYF